MASGPSTGNKLIAISVRVFRALNGSRNDLLRVWLFLLDLLERAVKSICLGTGLLFGVVSLLPHARLALSDILVGKTLAVLGLEVLVLSFHATFLSLVACLLAGACARLLYLTRLVYRPAGWVGSALLLGVPCVYLAAWMIQDWVPGASLLEGCLLCIIPTAFFLAPCFEYAETLIPELVPLLAGLWRRVQHVSSHASEANPTGDSQAKGDEARARYAEILGISGTFTLGELRQRYRELAQQYHPDKVQHLGPKLRTTAEQEMKKINEAYHYLEQNGMAVEGED